jgi:hypothetical protein
VEAAAEIPEGKTDDRTRDGNEPTSPSPASQAGQSNASSNTTASSSSTSRGVCSVQKWREAARGTAADRPTRQCQLLVTEVADDPG